MDFAPLPLDVITAAVANARRLRREVATALEYHGLTWEQFLTLLEIDGYPSTHGGSIARRTGLPRQTIHRYLQVFEQRGLVRWRPQPWVVLVDLTEEGTQVLRHAVADLADICAAIGRIRIEERRCLITAEHSIRRELRRQPRAPGWLERYLQPQLWDDDDL
jgi:DNA-binding MarR family transcriptional regulator